MSSKSTSRIGAAFDAAREEGRAAFIPFVMAGDPDLETSAEILRALPAAGADIIELGVAFTDPMADGPAIQAAGLRALQSGQTLTKTLKMVSQFRDEGGTTPIVLMGYANPILQRGVATFAAEAAEAGVDGLIVVDLPPEEDGSLRAAAEPLGIDVIRLATPTTDDRRRQTVINGARGFIYYVAVAGVTGRKSAVVESVRPAIAELKSASGLPVAVGFGVKTPEQAAQFGAFADGVVVGSAIVDKIADALKDGQTYARTQAETRVSVISSVTKFVEELSAAARHGKGA